MPRFRDRSLTTISSMLCLVALMLTFTLVGTGCVSSGTGVPKDEVVTIDSITTLNYRYGWRQTLNAERRDEISHARILGDLLVVTYEPSNIVTALNMSNGSIAWSTVVGLPSRRVFAPIRSGDSVYVSNETRMFQLNAQSGRIVDSHDLDGVASTSPVVMGDNAVFGGVNGLVWSQRLGSGAARWSFGMSGGIHTPPLVVQDNRVLVGDRSGNITLFDERGNTVWTTRALANLSAPAASPGVAIYAPCADNTLYAFSVTNGGERWLPYHADAPLTEAPLADGRTIYLPIPGHPMVALDASSGNELWTLDRPATPVAFLNSGHVLANDGEYLYVIAPDTGEILSELPTSGVDQVLVDSNKRIVLITPEGRVMLMAPRS